MYHMLSNYFLWLEFEFQYLQQVSLLQNINKDLVEKNKISLQLAFKLNN